jgi:hypothetical protein
VRGVERQIRREKRGQRPEGRDDGRFEELRVNSGEIGGDKEILRGVEADL